MMETALAQEQKKTAANDQLEIVQAIRRMRSMNNARSIYKGPAM